MATARHLHSKLMTVDEYLAFEEQSDTRHEFVDGDIYAFAGVTRRHSNIVTNIVLAIGPRAGGLGCELHVEAVKLKAAPSKIYYPDIQIVCDPDDDDQLIVLQPCFIVEVLSPSTEMIDLREKSVVYRNIASLQSFALVYQDRQEVIHNYRDESGKWARQILTEGSFEIPCLSTELSLDQIYRRLPD